MKPGIRAGQRIAVDSATSSCYDLYMLRVGLAIAVLLGGCVSLSPEDARVMANLQRLIARTATVYGVPTPSLMVGAHASGEGGTLRAGGLITLSTDSLRSPFVSALVAHELAHYLLGHHAEPRPTFHNLHEWSAWQQPRELDANAKAVELLHRVGRDQGLTQRLALDYYYGFLAGWHRAGGWALGHLSACEEIADLLRRFPEERHWTENLECAR